MSQVVQPGMLATEPPNLTSRVAFFSCPDALNQGGPLILFGSRFQYPHTVSNGNHADCIKACGVGSTKVAPATLNNGSIAYDFGGLIKNKRKALRALIKSVTVDAL